MRRVIKRHLAACLSRVGVLGRLERMDARQPDVLRVLTYHRVDEEDGGSCLDPDLISATPEQFRQQMVWLRKNYRVLPLDEVIDCLERGEQVPSRSVLITFDDAYRDFYDNAWPILRSLELPATLFVPTAYLDGTLRCFWWDELYAGLRSFRRAAISIPDLGTFSLATPGARRSLLRRLRSLALTLPQDRLQAFVHRILDLLQAPPINESSTISWHELEEMVAQGLAVGNHTWRHSSLPTLTPAEVALEVGRANAAIKEHLGRVWPAFAYPYGRYCDVAVRTLEREGFRVAFTTRSGFNHRPAEATMEMRRIGVSRHYSLDEFRLHMTTFYMMSRRVR